MNCIKKGTNVYAKLNDTVIDGTPCIKSSVYFSHHYRGRAVCVEGICKVSKKLIFIHIKNLISKIKYT